MEVLVLSISASIEAQFTETNPIGEVIKPQTPHLPNLKYMVYHTTRRTLVARAAVSGGADTL